MMDIRSRSAPVLLLAMLSGCTTPSAVHDGVYIWGAEVETFSPCGTDKTWWVLTSEPLWLQLRDAHQALTTRPYEGIFAEVSGYYDGPASQEAGGGFATQYDGLFRITAVRFTRSRADSDCKTAANLSR